MKAKSVIERNTCRLLVRSISDIGHPRQLQRDAVLRNAKQAEQIYRSPAAPTSPSFNAAATIGFAQSGVLGRLSGFMIFPALRWSTSLGLGGIPSAGSASSLLS